MTAPVNSTPLTQSEAVPLLKTAISQTHSALVLQRCWRRRKMTPLERLEDRFKKGMEEHMTHDMLTNLYKPTGKLLGRGAEGYVYEGVSSFNNKNLALKFTSCYADTALLFPRINDAINSTPHLTKIVAAHTAIVHYTNNSEAPKFGINDSVPQFLQSHPSLFFVRETNEGCTLPLRDLRCVTVMEKLEGDLEAYSDKNRNIYMAQQHNPFDLYDLQTIFTVRMIAKNHGLTRLDPKYRNVFYKKLTEEDTFKGKKLIEYDYWKYRICEQEFYIPKTDLLIKLGDYDMWQVTECPPNSDEISAAKEEKFQSTFQDVRIGRTLTKITSPQFLEKYAKPKDENARILDMGGF